MPQPRFKPTDDQRRTVKSLSGYGVPQDDIARIVKCDRKTMTYYFRDELDLGMAEANSLVGQSLFRMATNGNVSAAIFWLKARAGWREKHEVQITGPEDGPLRISWERVE